MVAGAEPVLMVFSFCSLLQAKQQRHVVTMHSRKRRPMGTLSTSTVVLIHGLWMTPLAWEHWVERYEARGFTVLTRVARPVAGELG
jgi:alpha-beta hydrolase superfamily lysophospholipase